MVIPKKNDRITFQSEILIILGKFILIVENSPQKHVPKIFFYKISYWAVLPLLFNKKYDTSLMKYRYPLILVHSSLS